MVYSLYHALQVHILTLEENSYIISYMLQIVICRTYKTLGAAIFLKF